MGFVYVQVNARKLRIISRKSLLPLFPFFLLLFQYGFFCKWVLLSLLDLSLFLTLKENCEEKSVTVVEEEILLAKNGDSSLISESIALEEEKLLKIREDEEKANCDGSGVAPDLNDTQFTRLDELLTQTKLFSEFLLEKMEDITKVIFCLLSSCWF